jgi:hypothetical protein
METESNSVEQNIVKEVSNPIFNNKFWVKFLGILMLIYGIFMALSIVGLLIAWLPIWLGILLMRTASNIEQAQILGNKFALIKAQQSLSTYFTIYGVLAMIGLIFTVVFMIVFFATGMMTNFQELVPDYY